MAKRSSIPGENSSVNSVAARLAVYATLAAAAAGSAALALRRRRLPMPGSAVPVDVRIPLVPSRNTGPRPTVRRMVSGEFRLCDDLPGRSSRGASVKTTLPWSGNVRPADFAASKRNTSRMPETQMGRAGAR